MNPSLTGVEVAMGPIAEVTELKAVFVLVADMLEINERIGSSGYDREERDTKGKSAVDHSLWHAKCIEHLP